MFLPTWEYAYGSEKAGRLAKGAMLRTHRAVPRTAAKVEDRILEGFVNEYSLKYIEGQSRPKTYSIYNIVCRIDNLGSKTLMIVELKQHTIYVEPASRAHNQSLFRDTWRHNCNYSRFVSFVSLPRRIMQCQYIVISTLYMHIMLLSVFISNEITFDCSTENSHRVYKWYRLNLCIHAMYIQLHSLHNVTMRDPDC